MMNHNNIRDTTLWYKALKIGFSFINCFRSSFLLVQLVSWKVLDLTTVTWDASFPALTSLSLLLSLFVVLFPEGFVG